MSKSEFLYEENLMETKVNDVITLKENRSFLRTTLFKIFALNSIDAMLFYYSLGKKSQIPVIGWFFRIWMNTYYKLVHTSAVKLPQKDIEEIIDKANHLSVGPCPCRLIFDGNDCDAPIYTCIKVNYFSEEVTKMQKIANKLSEKKGLELGNKRSKVLTKDEAKEVVRNARKYNLIFSLESCIQPYQNNICMCCTDCCLELKMRHEFGLNVAPGGPYIPEFNNDSCVDCGVCSENCPVAAIEKKNGKLCVNLDKCLGCGICQEKCPNDSLKLVVMPERLPSQKEPGFFKKGFILGLLIFSFISFYVYKLFNKSQNFKYFQGKPRESDVIQ